MVKRLVDSIEGLEGWRNKMSKGIGLKGVFYYMNMGEFVYWFICGCKFGLCLVWSYYE